MEWTEVQALQSNDGVTGQQNDATTLVSNTGQTTDRTNDFISDHAQMFKTGTNADGYKLTSVVMNMLSTATTEPTYTVTIHDRQGISPPREPTTNLVGTLTNPATLPSTFGEVVFNASGDGISLDANKFYWMVIDVSTGDSTTKVESTTSKDEDSGAATGWSIIDSHNRRSNDSSSWSPASTGWVLQLAVRGTVTDATPPTFSSAVVADSTLRLTFNENLDTGSLPAPGDFHVTVGDSRRNVADGGVAIADATVTLTLESAVVAADTVKVRYTKPSTNPLQDPAGNDVATFADQVVTNTTPPEFSSAAVNGATLTVTFNEDLDTGSVPAPGDFHVTVGDSRRNVADAGVAIAGATVTLTLESAVVAGDTVKVRYTKPSTNPLRDIGGNEVATFADQVVTNTTAPVFSGAAVNGAVVTVSFDEDLDTGSVPAPGDFHVTVGGSRRNVASGGVAIAGATVTLTLESAASAADTVKVRYAKPATNPLRDIGGNEVATFADQPVINTTGSLVSNAGQTDQAINLAADQAQAFTTGSHPGGYTLSGVDVYMRRGTSDSAFAIAIHLDDSGGPGDSVESLSWTSVSIPSMKGAMRLAADSDGIALEPNRTYWLVIDVTITSDTKIYRTTSDAEDAGAAQDWSIADTSRARFLGTTWDPPKSESIQLAVHATPNRPRWRSATTGSPTAATPA